MFAAIVLAAVAASADGAASTTVPFTLFDNRILVDVTLDGEGPFAMIVDTGSGRLVISPSVAQRLDLPTRSAGAVTGAGSGSSRLALTRVPSVGLGALVYRELPADVIDLSPIRRAIGFPRLDGVIGYSMLRDRRVGVDMDARRLTISAGPLSVPKTAASVPFALRNDLINVAAAVDGVHGTFLVDTGDRWSLTLFRRFAEENDFYRDALARNVVTGMGVGGLVYGDVLRTTVSLFGQTVSGVVTRASRDRGGVFATGPEDASIGNGLLKRFNIVYDYVERKMYAWPSHGFADSDPFRPLSGPTALPSPAPTLPRHAVFGAAVARGESGGVRVTFVVPNGAAAGAGLTAGDTIVAVGGLRVESVAQFLQAIHDLRAQARVSVEAVRAGVPLRLTATLGIAQDEGGAGISTQYRAISVDDSLRRTLLTVPQTAARAPAVLFVGGIGCYSVDVASNPQDAYLRLSHDLAKAGFVTMRLEKSGVGDSEGPPCRNVDFDAEVRGYAAALSALKRDPRVDPARIFLLGHSIGTVIVPRLASRNAVAGLIVLEAVGRDWPEYEIRNLRRDLELDGMAPGAVDAALTEKSRCMQLLLFENEPEDAIERRMPYCRVHDDIYPVTVDYVRQVAQLNAIEPWMHLNLPTLVVYGTSDFETEQADHERIASAANAADAHSATLVVLTGMSHRLGRAASQKDALADDDSGAIEPYDTDLSAAVLAWLTGLSTSVKRPSP